MDAKSETIVRRFIDGEKQLQSKLVEIHEKLTDTDCTAHDLYLKAFFNDNVNELIIQKKNILRQTPPTKNKPSWKKQEKLKKK